MIVDVLRRTSTLRLLDRLNEAQFGASGRNENRLRHYLEQAKAHSEAFRDLDVQQFSNWPIMSKTDVRQFPRGYRNQSYQGTVFQKKTSGSTGTPFEYVSSSEAQSYLWASILLAWQAAGYQLGERVAFLAGAALFSRGFKHRVFYGLMNVQPLSAIGMDDALLAAHCRVLLKQRVRLIYGYANALHVLAQYVKRHPGALKGHHLRAVVSTAENLTPQARADIENALGVPVFNQYGCNDAGVSAFECSAHQGMHVIAERCHVEVLADGRLVSTDLANQASFFIRYETGDLAELDYSECECGRHWPRIARIAGRANDLVKDQAGKRFPAAYFTELFAGSEVTAFQVLFDQRSIRVHIEADAEVEMAAYLKRLQQDLAFERYEVLRAPFQVQPNGKRRYVLEVDEMP
ncbi:phenylacetate--CoA ligase family protein [Chitinibacteraceae bacterium HSL-7]